MSLATSLEDVSIDPAPIVMNGYTKLAVAEQDLSVDSRRARVSKCVTHRLAGDSADLISDERVYPARVAMDNEVECPGVRRAQFSSGPGQRLCQVICGADPKAQFGHSRVWLEGPSSVMRSDRSLVRGASISCDQRHYGVTSHEACGNRRRSSEPYGRRKYSTDR